MVAKLAVQKHILTGLNKLAITSACGEWCLTAHAKDSGCFWHGNKPCACVRVQSTKFMLGIITAVICSNWLGEWIHSGGIYETDLETDGSVIFLKPSPPRNLLSKTAEQVMTSQVW